METISRTIRHDETLGLEAFCLQGYAQPFPRHFHDYYVFGYVVSGKRELLCNGLELQLSPSNLLIFNPRDNHECVSTAASPLLHYLGFNISEERMQEISLELTGESFLPQFKPTVFSDESAGSAFLELHQLIMKEADELRKEELFYVLFSRLFRKYAHTSLGSRPLRSSQIKEACDYLESHASETITLDDICQRVAVSKSSLIRSFSRQLGLTPHSYLMSIRVKKAQTLLKRGIPPSLVALQSGFADQAHFSNVCNRLTGLTPGNYQNIFLKKAPSSNDSE